MKRRTLFPITLLFLLASGCVAPQVTQSVISISIVADGQTHKITVPAGTTAQAAYTSAGITLNSLDRSDPPLYTVLTNGASLKLTRVREEFEVKDETIPFERQVVRNESLTDGETLLVQPGANGTQEITYRHLYEDGKETSVTIFKTVTLKEAVPEVLMVGVQAPFASVPLPGKLAYLIAGNAWVMQASTGNRIPVVTTGDLDGRIFSLSLDGNWLLYTRKPAGDAADVINSLWVSRVSDQPSIPIDLKVNNVVHFADWVPNSPQTISYSSVEPRQAPPGWQANNDLQLLTFSASGIITKRKELVEANSGGIYGWWGMTYAWSPDGKQLAYARPDGVGLVDVKDGHFTSLMELTPLQTHGDWAWVPPLSWGPDGSVLFTLSHPPASAAIAPEESPVFDLTALLLNQGPPVSLVSQSGMFAYPAASPWQTGSGYQVAYLQAIFPDQSENSRYRLMVMDRDGSNRTALFPDESSSGLDHPQVVAWSPQPLEGDGLSMAIIYQGNIWLVNAKDGKTQQITGDGLASRIDWK